MKTINYQNRKAMHAKPILKLLPLCLLLGVASAPAWGQAHHHHAEPTTSVPAESSAPIHNAPVMSAPAATIEPVAEDMDHSKMQSSTAPSDARDPHAYSDGYKLGEGKYALSNKREYHLADELAFYTVMLDRVEYAKSKDSDAFTLDGQLSYGTTFNKLVLKTEGTIAKSQLQEGRAELLWEHAISAYWDTQIGLRADKNANKNRQWFAVGVQGVAPYWFHIDGTAYIGNEGRTALRLAAEYDLRLQQRLFLQPRIEMNIYGKDDAINGIGSGISSGVMGLRLRYEINRQVAPYIGVEREMHFGKTADYIRASGERTHETRWIAGVRVWF